MIIKEDLMLRNILGEWIVVPMGERLMEFNGMIKVNESGAFIWKQLEAENTREHIIEAVLEEYEIDADRAALEVDAFIIMLRNANILEE